MKQAIYFTLATAIAGIASFFYCSSPVVVPPATRIIKTAERESSVTSPVGSYNRQLAIGIGENLILSLDGSFVLFTNGKLTDQGRWDWDRSDTIELYGYNSNYKGGLKCSYLYSEGAAVRIATGNDEPIYVRE